MSSDHKKPGADSSWRIPSSVSASHQGQSPQTPWEDYSSALAPSVTILPKRIKHRNILYPPRAIRELSICTYCLKYLKTNSLSNKQKYIHIFFAGHTAFWGHIKGHTPFITWSLSTATVLFKANILFWLNICLALFCPSISAILLGNYGGFHTEWESRSRPRLLRNHRWGNHIH